MNYIDLGIRSLLPDWRKLLNKDYLRDDIFAALSLSLVAIPLSLAIALASGVEPAVGLITAIVSGIVCALFGGNPTSVAGPAAAMAVIVGVAVESYGMVGLFFIGLICGLLQVLTGILGLGRYVRLTPVSVVEGFTAGIGAIIFIAQLPHALGLPAPSESHVPDVISHIATLVQESNLVAVSVAGCVMLLLWGLPKVFPKLPSPLIALLLPSIAAYYLASGQLDLIGEITKDLSWPSIPDWPSEIDFFELLGTACLVYSLASLETLLSCTAVDKLMKNQPSDLNQELIGQGLGNMLVAFFGGMPVTAVIVRSATNVMAGAKTRRASILHSFMIVLIVFLAAPVIGLIPVSALAGLLLFIAARMMNPMKFVKLFSLSRSEGAIYAVTFLIIVFVDLLEGVQWGMLAALAVVALQVGRTRILFPDSQLGSDGSYRCELEGSLTFLSLIKLDELKKKLQVLSANKTIVFDMRSMTKIDGSGAEVFLELLHELKNKGHRLAISGLKETEKQFLLSADSTGLVRDVVASTEQQLMRIVEGGGSDEPALRLEKGLNRFLDQERHRYKELFGQLSQGQTPHTLFITCSDSRIQPNLMTSTDPGELFIVRNVGNMIPRYQAGSAFAEGAAVDFAVGVLGVKEIVVCAHSGCGAVKALHGHDVLPEGLKSLEAWRHATVTNESYHPLPSEMSFDEVSRINALQQLENLRSYPIVREKELAGELKLHAWYFEIVNGEVEIWSSDNKKYYRHSEKKQYI